MKIVNHSKMPAVVYELLKVDMYDFTPNKDKISATQLLKPVQEHILTQRHYAEIEIDAIDRIWAIFGSGIHKVFEASKLADYQEQRIAVDIEGKTISGKFDMILKNRLIDLKVISAWSIVFGSREDDWRKQLSIYRWLYWKETGKLLPESAVKLDDTGYILAICRDFDKKRVGGKNYPELPILEIPVKLLSIEDTEKAVIGKIKMIKEAEGMTDEMLPECTDEQRWWSAKDKVYRRCQKYCPAFKFCSQAQAKGE